MKKETALILILSIILIFLASCSENSPASNHNHPDSGDNNGPQHPVPHEIEEMDDQFYLSGEVIDLEYDVLINVTGSDYAFGPYRVLVSSETNVVDFDGNKISADEIKIGDIITVVYSGQIMMSYPPQIAAKTVYLH